MAISCTYKWFLRRIESNSLARNVKDEPQLASIVVDGNELQRVSSAKLLRLTITSNFTWNEHIGDVIKKASKCLYVLV